jgi:hypothetical protein
VSWKLSKKKKNINDVFNFVLKCTISIDWETLSRANNILKHKSFVLFNNIDTVEIALITTKPMPFLCLDEIDFFNRTKDIDDGLIKEKFSSLPNQNPRFVSRVCTGHKK